MSDIVNFFKLTNNGLTFQADVQVDIDAEAPWDREDGHGPVRSVAYNRFSGNRTDKKPGERIIDVGNRTAWVYDFAEALKIAKRDNWGSAKATPDMTPAQVRELAVMEDMERMGSWLRSEWGYIGVVVTLLDVKGRKTEVFDALWGIESDSHDYITEEAQRMADTIAKDYADKNEIVKVIKIRN